MWSRLPTKGTFKETAPEEAEKSCLKTAEGSRLGYHRHSHHGGADRDRTDDLRLAKPALSQLSYSPMMVGLGGFEPPTSRLSGGRSNQLSYRPAPTVLFIGQGQARSLSPSDSEDKALRSVSSTTRSGLQKLNSVQRRNESWPKSFPIERVTGRTRDSNPFVRTVARATSYQTNFDLVMYEIYSVRLRLQNSQRTQAVIPTP